MYVPSHFEGGDAWARDFLRAQNVGTVITQGAHQLHANVVPLLFDEAKMTFRGHIARANPQWSDLKSCAVGTPEALVTFLGAHAYVSPNFYPSKAEHHRVVPTWNYEAVHVYGAFHVHPEPEWLLSLITDLTNHHEAANARPWRVSDAPEEFIQGLLHNIIGIEIAITRIDAKRKLSQNRAEADRWGTMAGLRDRERDVLSQTVANKMESLEP